MDKLFFPVRILKKKRAEEFRDGKIFMRSLSEFGAWRRIENKDDPNLVNSYRGDLKEGAFKNVIDPNKDAFFKLFPEELKKSIRSGKLIDYGDVQYFNLLCLYCYFYDSRNKAFEQPSANIKLFGDTAVIIKDTDKFLDRFLDRVEGKEKYTCLINRVEYYDEGTVESLNPFFNKTQDFSWQNELRFALGRLDTENKLSNDRYPILKSFEPLNLEMESLRDITMSVPIDDFISGNFDFSQIRFANRADDISPIEKAMQITKNILSEYRTRLFTATLDIG